MEITPVAAAAIPNLPNLRHLLASPDFQIFEKLLQPDAANPLERLDIMSCNVPLAEITEGQVEATLTYLERRNPVGCDPRTFTIHVIGAALLMQNEVHQLRASPHLRIREVPRYEIDTLAVPDVFPSLGSKWVRPR